MSTYEFKGGAHGNDKIKLLNLDAKSGKTIELNDFINDIDGFTSVAKSQFISSLDQNKDQLTIENFFFGEPFHLPQNIGFSEEGLVLIYNVYEVASYDLGYTEFMIPYNEAEPYLKIN
nr:RsiV family protein [Winogradskyella sp. SM1960]